MAQAKIVITAQDKTKQGISSAQKNLKELNDVASSLGINLSKLTATGAVVAGLTALAKGAKECCEAFLETENTYLILKTSLKDTKSYDTAINSINKLSKTTLSSREDVAKLYTTLVQLGKSDAEINKIVEASISLANVTGKSLTESFNVMLDSLDGSTGTLQKYLPEVKNLTKEELALGKAIDLTNKAFSETAKSISTDSYSQQIKNIKDDVTTIAEDIGYILMESLSPVFEWIEESIESVKDTVDKWRDNVDKKSSVLGMRDSATKNSASYYVYQGYLDNRTSKGGIMTGTSLYTLKGFDNTIVDATSALEAYSAVMEMAEAGILSVDDSYAKEVLERCRNIDTTVDLQYEELKKQTKNTVSAKVSSSTSTSSSDNSSLWLSEATRESNFTLYSERFADYFFTDFREQFNDILSEGKQHYEADDTDRAKKLIDYANTAFERNVRFSFLDKFNETLKSGGDVLFSHHTEEQISDLSQSFLLSWYSENIKLMSDYKSLCDEVYTDIGRSLSNYASTYLSDESYEGYSEYLQAELLKEIQQLVREAELIGRAGDPQIAYLKEIANNIENGIIPNLDVSGTINSKYKYLSEDTKRAIEIANLRTEITDIANLMSDMRLNQEKGFEYYSELDFKALEEIMSGMMGALAELINYTPTTVSASDRANDYINANSSYLSEKQQAEKRVEVAKNNIKNTEEEIDKLYKSDEFKEKQSDKQLQELFDIRNGQLEELKELENIVNTVISLDSGSINDAVGGSLDSIFDTESIDISFLDSLSGSLGSLFEAIEPLISVILSSNPLLAFLILIVQEMVEILSPFLEDTIKPFTDLIHTLAESLSGWITPILNVVKGVLAGICDCLEMVLLPVLEIITPIIQAICGILNVFKPVMEWLKNCFIEISTIITFVADAIKYAIWSFLNWMDGVKIWKWRPFEGVGGYDVSTLDSYDSNTGGLSIGATKKSLQEKFAYDVTDWTATNEGQDTSTSTSVKTASYTGSNNYYFSIYQQAPVVGDGGMQEFAKMIKMEFAELAYIGA